MVIGWFHSLLQYQRIGKETPFCNSVIPTYGLLSSILSLILLLGATQYFWTTTFKGESQAPTYTELHLLKCYSNGLHSFFSVR